MKQNEIIAALHAQLKEAAQTIFNRLELNPGRYSAAEIEKALNLSESFGAFNQLNFADLQKRLTEAREAFDAVNDNYHLECVELAKNSTPRSLNSQIKTAALEYNCALARVKTCENNLAKAYEIERKSTGLTDIVTISFDTFRASMPSALVFAKLIEWEKEFKIKTADKAVFVKEEESEVIGSCVVEFPKEAKFITDYCSADFYRPLLAGVLLDAENSCIVATDTHVLTEMPVAISETEGEPLKLVIDPKIIKAVAGKRCAVKFLKDAEKNISIRTEEEDVYTCENIRGRYPDYRRVYPKVNRDGLAELTKEGIKALANFAKATVKQTNEKKGDKVCIKITIPAYSAEGTAIYFDDVYQAEKCVKFAVKGSPKIDIVFGIDALNLSIVTKNWNGCLWFTDPSRPIVFDNKNTACTITMPMQLLDCTSSNSGSCAGVVDALKRHNYDITEPDAKKEEPEEEPETVDSETVDMIVELLEIFAKIGAILAMCAKMIEIENIALNADIPLEDPAPPIKNIGAGPEEIKSPEYDIVSKDRDPIPKAKKIVILTVEWPPEKAEKKDISIYPRLSAPHDHHTNFPDPRKWFNANSPPEMMN